MPIFDGNEYQLMSIEKFYDADGSVWIKAKAHAAWTADTPYEVFWNTTGYVSKALTDEAVYYYLGVANDATPINTVGRLQIGGYKASMVVSGLSVTAGHGVKILDGAVAGTGAAYSGANTEFGVCVDTIAAANAMNIMLIDQRVLGTT